MERGLKIPQNKCTKTTNSLLISLMKQLEKLEQKQKYAAWKAADIRKAVKEGRKPQAGPPAGDDDLSVPSSTTSGSYERIQLETSRLYRQAKVNPIAACLPTLATIPIWIGLYQTLSNVANEIALEGKLQVPMS